MDTEDDIDRAQRAKRGTPFLSSTQAAAWLGIAHRRLQRLRAEGEGPIFRIHSRYVQYHVDDLVAWSNEQATRKVRRARSRKARENENG